MHVFTHMYKYVHSHNLLQKNNNTGLIIQHDALSNTHGDSTNNKCGFKPINSSSSQEAITSPRNMGTQTSGLADLQRLGSTTSIFLRMCGKSQT